MPTHNVDLTEHQSEFIREIMEEGRYKSAGEVVGAGLRLLEAQEEEERLKLERLRIEVQKGLDDIKAGRSTKIGTPEELSKVFDEIEQEAEQIFQEEDDRVKTP